MKVCYITCDESVLHHISNTLSPGTNFMTDSSIVIQIWWKIGFRVTPL